MFGSFFFKVIILIFRSEIKIKIRTSTQQVRISPKCSPKKTRNQQKLDGRISGREFDSPSLTVEIFDLRIFSSNAQFTQGHIKRHPRGWADWLRKWWVRAALLNLVLDHEQQCVHTPVCTRVHTKFSMYRFVHVYCNCATIMMPILNPEFQGPQPDGCA